MSGLLQCVLGLVHKSRLHYSKGPNKKIAHLCAIAKTLANTATMSTSSMDIGHGTKDATSSTFQGVADRFRGITVNSEAEKCPLQEFSEKLDNSLKLWREKDQRGIWFKVHLDEAEWVPILAKKGFKFHHAKEQFVMMYLWLHATETSNIPPYAHTMIGVGAVVINDKSQVLVVREKHYLLPHWKLPGGYVEPGENLVDAAVREVMEETGISTEFQSLLTLRHAHHGMFGCSDIYTVVSLKPISRDIKKCDREIEHCEWMDVAEYLSHPHVHELNRFFVAKYLQYSEKNLKIDVHHGIHQILKKPYCVYYIDDANNS